jgi:hypothetical protein
MPRVEVVNLRQTPDTLTSGLEKVMLVENLMNLQLNPLIQNHPLVIVLVMKRLGE